MTLIVVLEYVMYYICGVCGSWTGNTTSLVLSCVLVHLFCFHIMSSAGTPVFVSVLYRLYAPQDICQVGLLRELCNPFKDCS